MAKRITLDISLAIPGMPFNGKTFDTLSVGGSESAGYYMGKALARLGHRVTVFCNTEPMRCEDVDYLPLSLFKSYSEFATNDVCIVQRQPELLAQQYRSRFVALWSHDLALGRMAGIVNGVAWNFDRLFVLSEFQRQQYRDTYNVPEDLLYVTRNGVDLRTITQVREAMPKEVARNPLSLVYAARPERGLDILLTEIMPRILEREPKAQLFLCTYDNHADHLAEFYAHCKSVGDRLGAAVQYLGHLTKAQLYEVYHSAGLYVYPMPSKIGPEFDEVSCISLMEAQACGLPAVATARGAIPETLAIGAGAMVPWPGHTPAFYDAFADECLHLMRDRQAWQAASRAGIAHAATLDWDAVADEWSSLFETEIRKHSADLGTLANHFWRHSDIYAAKECLARLPADDPKSAAVRERIAQDWAFLDEPDGFRKQYERIGGTHNPAVLEWAKHEPRYAALRSWLANKLKAREDEQVQALAGGARYSSGDLRYSVLDYGCAHGAYAVNLLAELPHLAITGVDIDQHGIEMGYRFAEQLGVADRFRGVVGDHGRLADTSLPEFAEQYDCALAQEVLEHVPDPAAVLRSLEARVKDGGTVYITVPFGPWEYSDYFRYPWRAHLWEFDLHDLHELLDVKGAEADVTKRCMPYGMSPETEEALGWWVVTYKVTPKSRGVFGKIDWDRKLWLQRPRQTVSAAIMAGGPTVEETLHWCLRSLETVADEVVIADCGLSAEAHRVIDGYRRLDLDGKERKHWHNIKVVPGVDPKTEGFETPRNIALEHCTQDWVLWIDTDEKLVQPHCAAKYLRRNTYQGYSIRQHHFACDTQFEADLPVRLFRNNGKLRFHGMIHEHPESAINEGPGRTIVVNDLHIAHVGYLIESGRRVRFERNWPMLQADIQKYPTRKLQKHMIMRDEMLRCTYELQQNGNHATEEIRERARAVVDLWREHFRGQGHFTNSDPLHYYSQALAILGGGFDCAFQVSADKVEAKVNGATRVRFANIEDMQIELAFRAKQAAEPYAGRYW